MIRVQEARHPDLEVVSADMLDKDALCQAAEGCAAVYYPLHSMNDLHRDYVDLDRLAAQKMVEATLEFRITPRPA